MHGWQRAGKCFYFFSVPKPLLAPQIHPYIKSIVWTDTKHNILGLEFAWLLWLMHLKVFHEDKLLPSLHQCNVRFFNLSSLWPSIAIEVCTEDKLLTNFHQCDIDSYISNWVLSGPWIGMEVCTEEFVKQFKKKKKAQFWPFANNRILVQPKCL